MNRQGFSLTEVIVVQALLILVGTAGAMLLTTGQSSWTETKANVTLQENMRRIFRYISTELQASGLNSAGVLQVTVEDNTGFNNTDVIRFAIPVCPCGGDPMDSSGDVAHWGAPLQWGQNGCGAAYTVDNNQQVTICHLPSSNPTNRQTINVNENAVQAHMAHGDWLGACDQCDPDNYAGRFIEYRVIDGNGTMVRRALDVNLNTLTERVVGRNVTDFQVTLNGTETASVNVTLQTKAWRGRLKTLADSMEVFLRNRG